MTVFWWFVTCYFLMLNILDSLSAISLLCYDALMVARGKHPKDISFFSFVLSIFISFFYFLCILLSLSISFFFLLLIYCFVCFISLFNLNSTQPLVIWWFCQVCIRPCAIYIYTLWFHYAHPLITYTHAHTVRLSTIENVSVLTFNAIYCIKLLLQKHRNTLLHGTAYNAFSCLSGIYSPTTLQPTFYYI